MEKILNGKYLSNILNENLKNKLLKSNYSPIINILLIGNNPESKVYVNMKKKKCLDVGIIANIIELKEETTLVQIINLINQYNKNSDINGIMVQLPLPTHLKEYQNKILDTILPIKDVDGLTSYSLGKLITHKRLDINKLDNLNFFISSTVYGVLHLLSYYNIDIKGKNIGIIGNSSLLGMPLSIILSNLGGTVEICHIDTKNLIEHTINKDILITCCGVKELIKGDMIKEDIIIIDIGINVIMVNSKKKIYGDCEWSTVHHKAKKITPVPGGVGPMTISSLLEQTNKAYLLQNVNS